MRFPAKEIIKLFPLIYAPSNGADNVLLCIKLFC
nr:MAG TPA: hypothetical protein [Caudoviricetes sp.]